MTPSVDIVERIEDDVEAFEPFDVEAWILDVCMMRFKFDIGVELAGCVFGDLEASVSYELDA